MATARIERNLDRHILNLVDAIDVRTTDRGTWWDHRFPTSSTFGAMTMQPTNPYGYASMHDHIRCLLHKPQTTGKPMPWPGDGIQAECRAILHRDRVV